MLRLSVRFVCDHAHPELVIRLLISLADALDVVVFARQPRRIWSDPLHSPPITELQHCTVSSPDIVRNNSSPLICSQKCPPLVSTAVLFRQVVTSPVNEARPGHIVCKYGRTCRSRGGFSRVSAAVVKIPDIFQIGLFVATRSLSDLEPILLS